MSTIAIQRQTILKQIEEAAKKSQRLNTDIFLLAVSKKQSCAKIREAYDAGQRDFGENYVQEALKKMFALSNLAITWHFIGKIQSNKCRTIAENFSWVHSLDNLKIAERLSLFRPKHLPPLNVLIQVNLEEESHKAGISLPTLLDFVKLASSFKHLNVKGLMLLPKEKASLEERSQQFKKLAQCLKTLKTAGFPVDTLSMGMSADFQEAIACGSHWVRVGTAIFGKR